MRSATCRLSAPRRTKLASDASDRFRCPSALHRARPCIRQTANPERQGISGAPVRGNEPLTRGQVHEVDAGLIPSALPLPASQRRQNIADDRLTAIAHVDVLTVTLLTRLSDIVSRLQPGRQSASASLMAFDALSCWNVVDVIEAASEGHRQHVRRRHLRRRHRSTSSYGWTPSRGQHEIRGLFGAAVTSVALSDAISGLRNRCLARPARS